MPHFLLTDVTLEHASNSMHTEDEAISFHITAALGLLG
jgi:hypothetical protein